MKRLGLLAGVLLAATLALAAPASAATCGYPGESWERAQPGELGLDGGRLQEALDWATTHTSESVAVYRSGCLAGESRIDAVTRDMQLDGWSMTKTITAMLVGRAVTLKRLNIDKPIGRYYPKADAAHRALLPRHLLTMTAGTHRNWVRDLSPQYDRVRDALSLKFDHKPGSFWEYQQSNVSLLANVVERAVRQDVQEFAQRELFGPIGIKREDWKWDRDRSGNTEGWAHLHMRNGAWARLGHLLMRHGTWKGKRLIAKDYFKKMRSPGKVNNAYGFLIWLNRGGSFVLPNVEGYDSGTGPLIASGPKDMLIMAGSGEQRVIAVPSRDLIIVRLGERGSREGDTRASVWSGRGGELDNELVRRVLRSVTDVPYDDPGPYQGSDPYLPPPNDGIAGDARYPEQATAGVGVGPNAPQGCNPAGCDDR